jgi:plasmid stability protein
VLAAIADEHRRAALRTLANTGEEGLSLDALADEVGRRVRTKPADATSRQRVRIALHHMHLPKLDECKLVRYDPERRYVERTADRPARELLATLEAAESGGVGRP